MLDEEEGIMPLFIHQPRPAFSVLEMKFSSGIEERNNQVYRITDPTNSPQPGMHAKRPACPRLVFAPRSTPENDLHGPQP